MKRTLLAAPLLASAVFLAGCEGDDGKNGLDGPSGTDGLNSLVATRALPLGDASCPGGGLVFESGLDTNRNNVLDPAEVTSHGVPRLRDRAAPARAARVAGRAGRQRAGERRRGTDQRRLHRRFGFRAVTERSRVQVEAIIPSGNAIVIDETLDLDFSTDYTVIAVGDVAAPIAPLVIANPTGEPIAQGSFRAQVVHAAPDAPAVDVFVTAPGADLATSTPINAAPLAYQQSTDRIQAPAGDYQVRVTLGGNPATVVFDSGAIALPADADLLVAAVENTGPGATPIQLVVLDGTAAADLLDTSTPASVVAVHASPDAPAVDILADDKSTAAVEAIALASNVAFTQSCSIAAVPAPGEYGLSVTAAGAPSVVALQFDLDVAQADEAMAIVTGFLGSTPAIQPLPLVVSGRSVVTESKLRVTHGSPSTPAVDLYLVADGTNLNDAAVAPAFGAVPFGADTGILSIAPGVYDVYVTPAGDKGTVAINVQNLTLTGGEVLDVIARDPATNGSEGALPQLIIVDHQSIAACT